MKKFFVLIFFVWAGLVSAAETVQPLDENPELDKISTSQNKTTKAKPDLLLLKPNRLMLLYTAGQSGFKQSGSGQTYDTERGAGQGLLASYERELVTGRLLTFRAWTQDATFSEPANIGGRDVSVKRNFLNGTYGWQSQIQQHTFVAELGASVLNQDPGHFSVDQSLVPSYFSLGPSAGVTWKWNLSQSWGLLTQALVTVPVYFQENGDNSGSHQISGHYFASVLLEARLNRLLSLTFGLIAEGEQHRFDGDGDRGVSDANVSSTTLAFPLGVRYAF